MSASLPRQLLLSGLIACIYSSSTLGADSNLTTRPVVVTATRTEQSGFDLPVSIDSLSREQIQDGRLQVNLSESLGRIPGIVAQNRQNYAQDLQISSRGFGARSSFGVRGLRLYADDIPATMPDGQGQISHIDLGSAARIEVMRGPFSSLYGNSSGGVLAVFSEDGAPGAKIEPGIAFGSYGTERLSTKFSGDTGLLNYVADLSHFRTDGYRDHSAAKRDNLNTKLRWTLADGSRLTFVANAVDMPDIQDALGLSRAQYNANQRQATPEAYTFNTRKSTAQQQLGVNLEQDFGANDSARLMVYGGHRATVQFQAIPVANQVAAANPGGLIDLKRDYGGIDARWMHRAQLAGTPLSITGGVSYDNLDEARKGYQNFVGPSAAPTAIGVVGALRRDESNRIHNFDQYLQAQWEPATEWLLMAGVRHSQVKVGSQDHYIVAGNGDDSGSVDYSATTPVAGITWRMTPAVNLYMSAGKGFETPTMNELSYQPNGTPGLNLALQPAKSNNLEVGFKALLGESVRLSTAVFDISTHNEIVTASNAGGRATYQNVDGTKRTGIEFSLDADLGSNFALALAYTNLKAVYTQNFRSCRASGCTLATSLLIPAGNRMPGVPASMLYGELSWKHPASGFSAAVEVRDNAKVYVDDQNSDAATAYTIGNLRFGFDQKDAGWTFKEFLRVDNVTDTKYAGSVIVNDGNGRFFESAPGRNYLVGLTAGYKF